MPIGNRLKVATVRGIPMYVATSWIWIALIWGYRDLHELQPAVSSPGPRGVARDSSPGCCSSVASCCTRPRTRHRARLRTPRRRHHARVLGRRHRNRANATRSDGRVRDRVRGTRNDAGSGGGVLVRGAHGRPRTLRDILAEFARLNLFIGRLEHAARASRWTADGCCSPPCGRSRRAAGRPLRVAGYGGVVVGVALIGACDLTFRSATGFCRALRRVRRLHHADDRPRDGAAHAGSRHPGARHRGRRDAAAPDRAGPRRHVARGDVWTRGCARTRTRPSR